jgi:hypothetical protein
MAAAPGREANLMRAGERGTAQATVSAGAMEKSGTVSGFTITAFCRFWVSFLTCVVSLARYFGTSADFWLHLQSTYDKETAELALAKEIKAIEPMKAA